MSSKRAALAALAVIVCSAPAQANITISSHATSNMSCSNGVCAPTATDAVLNATDLEAMLASGNVKVTTTGSGVQSNNIDVAAKFAWSNSNTLDFDAYQSIAVDKPIAVQGPGGLTLTTNDGGSGGALAFTKKGHVAFKKLAGQLVINGTSFALEKSIAAMASAIAADPSGAFALADNYDASGDGAYTNSPITTVLTGSVEGLGNTISNLSIRFQKGRTTYLGLFAHVGTTGSIADLRLTGLRLTLITAAGTGGLAGLNEGVLSGDAVSGIMSSKGASVGGLVGANRGTITLSSAVAQISTPNGSGGLVASNGGTITLSHSDSVVPAGAGLVSLNEGIVSESYATGAATCGLVIDNQSDGTFTGQVENSYATGAVTSAGFVCTDTPSAATVSSSYSTGAGGAGFICDLAFGTSVSSAYWDTTTSGTTDGTCNGNYAEIVGLTTQQFQSGLPDGFDPAIWAENANINGGLPYLINNPPQS